MKPEGVRDYEAILIVHPERTGETASRLEAQFGEAVVRLGGRVLESSSLGKRKLTYPIGRSSEGAYLKLRLQMPPEKIGALKKSADGMEPIVRLMVVRAPAQSGITKGQIPMDQTMTKVSATKIGGSATQSGGQ